MERKLAWESDSVSGSKLCHVTGCKDLAYPFHMSNSTVCPEDGLGHVSESAGHNAIYLQVISESAAFTVIGTFDVLTAAAIPALFWVSFCGAIRVEVDSQYTHSEETT